MGVRDYFNPGRPETQMNLSVKAARQQPVARLLGGYYRHKVKP